MTQSPIITQDQLHDLGPLRLLYVPVGPDRPVDMTLVPIADWIATAKQSQSGFDDLDYWQQEIGKLGIGHDAVSVVLDDGSMTEAARVWFILQYFGLPVVVLNGGAFALDRPVAQLPAAVTPPVLTPGAGQVGLMARDDLRGALDDVQVFDARTAAEFSGEDLKGNARGGHLPGAVHLDHRDLLDGRQLRNAPALAARLAQAGFTPGRPVVSHCNGGGRAALAALAARAAGHDDVRVYYLSFADWAADESCPLR